MSFKIGDTVEVLYYEEGVEDAPSYYIGECGKIIQEEVHEQPHIWLVEFKEKIWGHKDWNFKTEQLKLVETN